MNAHTGRRAGVLLLALALTAASLPADKPEAVGLSSERLQRINQMMQGYIERGQITGGITMVSRRGKLAHFEAQGQMDLENKTPMRKDAILRIGSMSKPITGVAILMLMEEGRLRLTDFVNGGVLNGKRLLSPRTIDLMAANHVGDLYAGTGGSAKGLGFGLTVDVVLDNAASGRRVSNGTFAWGGAFGTYFWVDRKPDLILMVERGRIVERTTHEGAPEAQRRDLDLRQSHFSSVAETVQ